MARQPGYVGDDRRDWVSARAPSTPRLWGPSAVVVVSLAAVAVGVVSPEAQLVVYAAAVMAVGVLVLGSIAAAACLLHWRTGRDAPAALLGAALVLLGVGIAVRLVVAIGQGLPAAGSAELRTVSLGMTIAAGGLVVRAVRHPHIDTTLRPGRTLALVGLLAALVLGPITVAGGLASEPRAAARAVVGVVLLVAAVAVHRRFGAAPSGPHGWAAAAVALLGVSQVLLAAGILADPSWRLSAWAVQLGAAAMAAVGASDDLVRDQTGQRQRLYETLLDSRVTAANADGEKVLDRTRTHDLRSAVAAIQGASTVLERYAGQLDPDEQTKLQQAVHDQISRLSELVGGSGPQESFLVVDVVRSARANAHVPVGLHIGPSAEGAWVHGRPAPLAAVLAKMLDAVPSTEQGSLELAVDGEDDQVRIDLRGAGLRTTPWLTPSTLDVAAAETLLGVYGATMRVDPDDGIRLSLPVSNRVGRRE